MEYTVNKLAKLSGVSARTLRYYDEIGLLKPLRVAQSGYRIYGQEQVDLLQQILFYRELGVTLEEISFIIYDKDFIKLHALENHLSSLSQKKAQIELLIENVSKTIRSLKGEDDMTNAEKFEGFKKHLIEENETKYGTQIREKYGEEAVMAFNAKLAGMTKEQWKEQEMLSEEINECLRTAFKTGNPAGEEAQKLCDLHRKWLCMFWKEGTYSRQAHQCLGDGYVEDERFKAYYDQVVCGGAKFLRDALHIYCK